MDIKEIEIALVALQGQINLLNKRFDTTELKNASDVLGAKLDAITMQSEAAIRTVLAAAATVRP